MSTETFAVNGMTCSHCANSVSSEVGKVAGVTDVQVDVAGGRVTVTSDAPLDGTVVGQAVEEAGYQLVTA
ncbi:MAG TPA: heavy metal-associated domain-containing protein [Homoserinimonas sp.]|nr:heavy metal-associated domain-containing protein [Homoserinimonas sp.]